jgi:membrane-bound lytic murein transglycosylase D
MRALLPAIASSCLGLWLGSHASAQADPPDPAAHAGVQAAPPLRPAAPTLRQELDGRRSIRGCSVDERCARPGDLLREFEAEAFPPPGGSPWIDERKQAISRLEAPPPRPAVNRPSELRPDAPWLDQLELPDLPIRWSRTLVDYLVFYKDDPRGRSIMASWLVAQGRYGEMIAAHLRKARLPADLLYVAMIESGYDPDDLSSAGALGLWQFMPEGGRIYGLRADRWVDERRDPLRSTIAQMDYFADLYQRFADWHVALAAFNMGYGAMLRSIARYNTNDFYRLCEYENAIPWETCLYTPKVLAAAIVGHNRAVYGYDKLTPLPAERWEEVAVPTSVSLAAVASAAGASAAELKRLNPQLRHGRTPPGEPGYVVRVPAGTRAETQRRIAELEADWKGYDAYVIAHGERFEDVATTFGITVGQLRKLNDVTRDAEIEGGTVLVVPRITAEQRTKNQAKARANLHASGVDQRDGERLLVPVPDKAATVDGKRRVFYRVVAGDTLRGVARALAVTPAELAQWNALEREGNLQPRMVLLAWVAPTFDPAKRAVSLLDEAQLIVVTRGSPEHMDLAEARTGRVRTEYVAQGKEKLAEVARKFGMGSHDLARINRISYDTVLAKGQAIIVYQVADPSRSKRADEQWRKTPRARRGKLAGSHAARTASADQPDADEADGDADADADLAEADAGAPPTDLAEGTRSAGKPVGKASAAKASAAKASASKESAGNEPDRGEPRDGKSGGKPDARSTGSKKLDASEPGSAVQSDAPRSPPRSDAAGAAPGPLDSGPVTRPSQVR